MKAVGIKVLKNQLSRYLKEVEAGETVLVTDRERVIAEIHRPLTPVGGQVSRWDAFLNDQERRGKLRRPRRADVAMRGARRLAALPGGVDVGRLLDETRADRP
jgi:antitoxin (DNA-binding transcriptional repressor) of toxin-antitoxin stability system